MTMWYQSYVLTVLEMSRMYSIMIAVYNPCLYISTVFLQYQYDVLFSFNLF